jgi:hypothetical protein
MRISIVRSGSKSVMLLGLAACGAEGDDDPLPVDCAKEMAEGRVDTFVVGLDKPGKDGIYDFKLMSATPAPPARNNNTWIVQVNQMSMGVVGAPVDGATMKVTPFMPEHMHGTAVPAVITPQTEPGQYKMDPVNMWMEGVWEITVRATVGTTTDTALFKFCIP